MAKTLKIVIELDERAEVGEAGDLAANHVAGLMFGGELLPGVRLEILDGQRQSPVLAVDTGDHRVDLLSFLQDLARVLDATGPGNVRNVNQAINAVFNLDERAEVRQIADTSVHASTNVITFVQCLPWILLHLLHAETDAARLRIDAQHFNFHHVARIDDFARMLHALGPAHFRNVNQPFHARLEFDKGAVISHAGHAS